MRAGIMVREGRLELPCLAALDPKSSASASFATRAPEGLRECIAIGRTSELFDHPGPRPIRRMAPGGAGVWQS